MIAWQSIGGQHAVAWGIVDAKSAGRLPDKISSELGFRELFSRARALFIWKGIEMDIELKPLEEKDLERFAHDMQEAFQLAVDDADERHPLPVLPREDIDESLARPGAEALAAWIDGKLVGGTVVFANHDTHEYECALLYVAASEHSKGVGTELWKAIENYYPDAVSWELCTPYFEVRNIHFYLHKCGFHIVGLFEDPDPRGEEGPDDDHGEADGDDGLMFSFYKRLDGRWLNPGDVLAQIASRHRTGR